MKKKLLIALFVIAMLVCVFASCGECEHNYEETSKVEATCAQDGSKTLKCSECGETKTETIAKTNNHKMEYSEIEATCLADGKTVGVCKVCGYTVETNSTPKLDACESSNWEVVVKIPATCTTNGEKATVCTICGKEQFVIGDMTIPAFGHTYEDTDPMKSDEEKGITFVEANCEDEGYFARVCQTCGYDEDPITKDEYAAMPDCDLTKLDKMEPWGHNFTEYVDTVLPTCTENGYDIYGCEYCDATKNEVIAAANGHSYIKNETAEEGVHFKITLAPTCINTGTKAYICTVCSEVATANEHIDVIPTVEHSILDTDDAYLLVSMEADCVNAAYKIYKCSVDAFCTEQKVFEYGEALDHNWVKIQDPSCATNGKTYYECDRVCNGIECDEFKFDEPSIEIKHTYGSTVSAATCVADAVYKCSVCEKEYSAYDDDAQGQAHGNHKYDLLKEVIAPTCSSEGYTIYSCTAGECGTLYGDEEGEYDRDVTPRTTHDFNVMTEDGRIVCTVCATQYRDVTTEITTGNGTLCLGSCEGECTCGLKVEWNGYVSPKDPEQIKANETYVKNSVTWTEVAQETKPLAIGEGMIILNGTEATSYTIKVFDKQGGTLLTTIEISGEYAFVDLYNYAEVGHVEITATTDALVSFFAIVK